MTTVKESTNMLPMTLIVIVACVIIIHRAPFPVYWFALGIALGRIAWQLATKADESSTNDGQKEDGG
jgi:hypothetical protein